MATNEEPPEKDVKDFEFRQLCKFRVYPSPSTAVPVKRTQLLAVSSNFDLIFAAFNNEVKVLRFAALSQQDDGLEARERSTLILDAPCEERFTVAALVVHIAVSSDDLTLSIVTDDDAALHLLLFDLRTFAAQTSSPAPFAQYQLSAGQGSVLKDLTWNPAYPTLLAACLSDGTVALLEAGNTVTVKSSASLPATCLSWSPKGKQIMVGKHDGSSSQYDHELKLKKDWPAPTILTEPQQATDLLWISTYTFVASYLPQSADSTSQPSVVLTVSSKEGNSNYINFDDICFGSGEIRQPKYFFQYLAQWEMVIMSSCSATETTIVAKHLDDKSQWEHWNLEDSSRAELPVTDDQADSFPVGMCVTFSSQQALQLGDGKTHPSCPVLLLLSTDGVLVPFHMAYFHPQAPSLTAPPRPLSAQGARTPAGAQAAQAPVPSLHAATIQSSGSILVNLLSSAPTAPSPITPAAAASSGGGVTSGQQTAVRSLFGQPASVFGGSTQPTSSTPSFSFAPVATAASGAPAAAKPAFSFAAQKAGGSQAPPTAAQPQSVGVSVKATKPQECDALSASATQTRPSVVAAPAIFTQTTVPRPGQPTGGHSLAAPPTPSAASMPQFAAGATPASTQGGAGDPASKLFPFGGQPSKPAAENGALLGSRPAAAPAVGGFGATGSSGTISGSTGSAGAGFGSTGSAGAGFGSTGSAGPGFGSTGSASPGFGSTSSAGAGFGSTGGAGAGFGSTGSAGAVVGSTGGAGAGFGSTGSAGPGFGSTGSAGAGFGSTSGGGSSQFSFSFKPTVMSATTTSSLPPPVTSAVPAGNAEFAAQNQARAPSLAPSTPALSSTAALAPTPASTPALAVAPTPAPVSITSGANVGASVSVAKASQTSPSNGLMAGVSSGTSRSAATSSGDGREEREIDAMLDTTIAHNIAEEIEDFESELHNLRQRMSQPGPMVGSKKEMQTLIHNTNKMAAFCKEITSITAEHSREIHDLKGSCLDLFAMAEECRCRQDRNHDPHYLKALQQRTLDPATTQRMCRLRLCAQQIAQGLNDADAVLDSQWEAHIEKEKKMRIRIPNSDTLYRAIKSNHNVLVSRQHELERVQEQLKSLQVMNQTATWNNSLSINSSRGGAEAPSAAIQPRDWRLKKADLLTPEKVSLLKESLVNHRVRKVKCQPLTSLSQSRLVSVRNEPRASSVVSSDGSIQAASNSARDGELGSLAALSAADSGAVPFLTSTPATQLPGKEAPKMMQPPTSFSGLAYFKPKPTLPDASRLLDSAGSANGMLSQPGFAFAAGPGANFKKPQMQVPCVPGFGTSFAVYPGSQPAAPVSLPALPPSMPGSLPVRYEAVTPTEFADDEAYDEEDDYAGYEEDEEDDEDEEEAGFGDQYEYPAEDNVAGGLAEGSSGTPLSSLPSSGSTAAKPSGSRVSKNLFSVPASEAADPSTGAAALSALGAGGGRGSSGFSFAAPSSGSSHLATHLSGKPLFGSATSADHDTENKDGAGVASSSSVFGGNRGAVAASGFGLLAAKSTSPSSCITTTTASSGFFGTKSAPSGTPSLTAASTTASKPAGGLFGFSTVPTTVAASPPGTGLFGAGATFGALSSPSASKPSSPPVGFFAKVDNPTAVFTTASASDVGLSAATTTSSTTSAAGATSSVFGSGSSVFGGSAGAPSFSSLLKTEVTTATTASAAGDTTVSSSGGSLFGKPASSGGSGSGSVTAPASSSTTSSAGSPFSAAGTAATSTATTGSLFGTPASTAPSMSGPPAATSVSTTTAASSVSVFAATLPTSATRASSTAAAPATATPLPAAAAATLAPNTGSEVSSTPTAPSGGLFGSAMTAPSGGLFGSTTTAPSGGLFGSTTTTPSGGLFGSTTTTTTVPSGGLFGSTTTVPSGGLFGSTATTTAAPSGGLFGSSATTTTAPSGGLFGSSATTTTAPSGGLCGSSATTTTAPSGLFGSATTASSGGLFGSTTTASGGLFGSTTATTTASSGSLFGSSATTTTPSSGSLFAAPLSTPAPFGASVSTAAPSGGPLFGAPSSSAEASPFGSSAAQTSVFGSATSTTAGGSASGGASATMTTTSAPAFGFGQPSGLGGFSQPAFGSDSVFGQSSPGFGQTSGSGFGQTTAGTGFASSGFGQATTTTTESSSGSGGFGGLFGGSSGGGVFGLGAKPSEEKAKQNVFGTTQAFGAAPAATNSLFGGKGPAAFGSSNSQTSNSGGSGIFGGTGSGFGTAATGSGGVASMGFAVTQTTSNSSGGFGGGPAFGTSPSFGGSPAFGSAPSFGGSPGFGATATGGGGAFGSSAAFASPFGAGQQAPTTGGFSSFASNNTLTFGSLAQSSDTPSFGSMGQGSAGGFGAPASPGGGGFGAQNAPGFGAQNAPGFGAQSPGFGSGQQQQQPSGFGNTSFGSSPSFSSYRG